MGRPSTLPSPFGDLAIILGGVAALAEALQVSNSTLNRWARGKTEPPGLAKLCCEALCREYRIPINSLPWVRR